MAKVNTEKAHIYNFTNSPFGLEVDDDEILRLAEKIKKQHETPQFRDDQVVEMFLGQQSDLWVPVRYAKTGHKYRDLSWIDKAKIIAPPGVRCWAAVEYDGRCYIWGGEPHENVSAGCMISTEGHYGWFQAFPGPAENWREMCEEI